MGTEVIGYVLGQQCAPLLAGIKPSNLLIVEKGNKNGLRHVLHGTQICRYLLYSSQEKDYWLLFAPYELAKLLIQPDTAEYMTEYGYEPESLGAVLKKLSGRFRRYRESGAEFPHEMGVLLGYPLSDVKGFIENKGRNFKLSGYWKVYGDAAYAARMFEQYADARKTALSLCNQGVCILDIWKDFHSRKETEEQTAAG